MSDDITIRLGVDTTDGYRDLRELEQETDRVVREWQVKHRTIQRSMAQVRMSMSTAVSMVRNIYTLMGRTISPLENALINVIETALESILRVHAAMAAGTFGSSLIFTAAAATIAIGISLQNAMDVAAGIDESRQQLAAAQNLMNTAMYAISRGGI